MNQLVVISEIPPPPDNREGTLDKRKLDTALEKAGCLIYRVNSRWARDSDASEILDDLKPFPEPVSAILNGYIHSVDEYEELYNACAEKNLRMINSPADYAMAHSLQLAYPLLEELTPQTEFVDSPNDVENAIAKIGLPVFIKGAIQSQKDRGWKACVATNLNEAKQITGELLDRYHLSAGAVAIRELVSLQSEKPLIHDFPAAREYRLTVFQNRVIGKSHYWPETEPWPDLSPEDQTNITNLAEKAARLMQVPLVAVDIGQLESGEWIVIEIGDVQTAGLIETDREELVRGLLQGLG